MVCVFVGATILCCGATEAMQGIQRLLYVSGNAGQRPSPENMQESVCPFKPYAIQYQILL